MKDRAKKEGIWSRLRKGVSTMISCVTFYIGFGTLWSSHVASDVDRFNLYWDDTPSIS